MSWIDTLDRLITDSWKASRDESAAMLDTLLALSLAERWGLFQSRDPRLMFLSDGDYLVLFHSLNAHTLMAGAADHDHDAGPVTEEATAVLPIEAPSDEPLHGGLTGFDHPEAHHPEADHDHDHFHGHAGDPAAGTDGAPVVRPPSWRGRRGLRWLTLAVTAAAALVLAGATITIVVLALLSPGPAGSAGTAPLIDRLEQVERDQARFSRRLVQVDTQLADLGTLVDGRFDTTMRAVKLSAALHQLQAVMDRGLPFAAELDRVAPAGNGNAALTVLLTRLDGYAAAGVPTLPSLRERFEALAPRLTGSEPGPLDWLGSGFGLWESSDTRHLHGMLGSITAGLRLGNLSAAVTQLQDLHLYPTEDVDQWLAAARVRLDADTSLDALRQAILSNPTVAPEK